MAWREILKIRTLNPKMNMKPRRMCRSRLYPKTKLTFRNLSQRIQTTAQTFLGEIIFQ